MNKPTNVITVRNAKPGELPLAKATIYKKKSLMELPKLIYKVPGVGVVFDLDEWTSMCEESKAENVKKSERIHRPFEAL